MRIAASIAATTLLLGGCISMPQKHQVVPWSQKVGDDIPPFQHDVEFTLKDGRVERLKNVGDFGYAMCGEHACVRKDEIATVGYSPQRKSALATAVAVPMVAPALLTLGAICVTGCDLGTYGTYGPLGSKPKSSGPTVTPQQLGRVWLDALVIRDGKVVGADSPNECLGDKPTAVGREFANDVEAFEWIFANRNQVSMECLNRFFQFGRTLPGEDGAAKSLRARMQIAATYIVRSKWNIDRCVRVENQDYLWRQAALRVAPLNTFVSGERKGDPEALRILEETLADPATYEYEGDLPRTCSAGALPKGQWPSLETWRAAHSPFAPTPNLPPGLS